MYRIFALCAAFFFSQQLLAGCPSYLDHSLRELHSKNSVNLCDKFAGQPLLIINTASHCGFTPQFKGLEAVYQKYRAQGLVVVGFASDDFNQEDKDEGNAAKICYVNNGVTFTMLAPSKVRGSDANPVFHELATRTEAPSWNFNKYLVDRDGKVVSHFDSNVTPASKELRQAIERLL